MMGPRNAPSLGTRSLAALWSAPCCEILEPLSSWVPACINNRYVLWIYSMMSVKKEKNISPLEILMEIHSIDNKYVSLRLDGFARLLNSCVRTFRLPDVFEV
jgi:hypothetical protein